LSLVGKGGREGRTDDERKEGRKEGKKIIRHIKQ
jgi:hypothetical protein